MPRGSQDVHGIARMSVMAISHLRSDHAPATLPPVRSRYAREIVIVLVVKAIALAAIWHIWFSGPSRPAVDGSGVAARLGTPVHVAPVKGTTDARP